MYNLKTSIQIGDIILLRGSGKHSKIISKVTNGPFSHACLVVGDSQIIEALTSSGVQYTSCVKFVIADTDSIAVLRPKFTNDTQAKNCRSFIEDFAKDHQSKAYNLAGAIKSIFGTKREHNNEKYFCSQLVAEIYRHADFPLLEKKDHNITPNDFIKSSLLYDVTEETVGLVPDYIKDRISKRNYEITAIDQGGSTVSSNALLFRQFISRLKTTFSQYNLSPPREMFNIIDAITDPKNSSIARSLDSEITALFDEMLIMEKLQEEVRNEPDDLDELKNEIERYGKSFVEEELTYCLYAQNHMKNKWSENSQYHQVFTQICEKFSLTFACRMQDYYLFILKNIMHVSNCLNDRMLILENCFENN